MRTIEIRYGDFRAVLDADALDALPRANVKKLLKLARRDYRNESELRKLRSILEENASAAASAHAKAKEEFAAGWKYVNTKSLTKDAVETMQENNRLQNAVKRTKATLNKAKALLQILNEMEINQNGSSYNQ